MKSYFLVFIISILSFSCVNQEKEESRNIILGDTITTASGLKYIFLKEGTGKPVRVNSKVQEYMDMYLNESDSLFWSTADEKDSIFEFIHGKTTMIKGFEELNNYLVEGDEVIAILPDSLAYGKEGRGDMPPAATLVYNPLIVKMVSEPKITINDTLQKIVTIDGAEAAISFYKKIINTEQKNKYHTDMELISVLMDSLTDRKLYREIQDLSNYFSEIATDDGDLQFLTFYEALSLEKQGQLKGAIDVVNDILNKESNENREWWEEKKKGLEKSLDSITNN